MHVVIQMNTTGLTVQVQGVLYHPELSRWKRVQRLNLRSVREEGSCISGLTERLFWGGPVAKVTEASKIGPTACVVSLMRV